MSLYNENSSVYRSEGERNTFENRRTPVPDNRDTMVILPILLLLMAEKADKMLLFSLLYILM